MCNCHCQDVSRKMYEYVYCFRLAVCSLTLSLLMCMYGRDFLLGILLLEPCISLTCMKNQQIHELLIQFINYVWYLLHVSALHCHPQGAFLVPSERCSIEEQPTEYCGCSVLCLVTWCVAISDRHAPRHCT